MRLCSSCTVSGNESSETLANYASPNVCAEIARTFPMRFAEIISGDGEKASRKRIDLSDTTEFGSFNVTLSAELKGCKWVRFEARDIAANGACALPL